MSVGRFLQQAAAGNAGGPVYVDDVFSTYLYTGTNATQAVVNGLDLAGEGGLIWTKARTSDPNELDHQLMDSEQGAFRYVLESNTTNARFDFGGSIVTPNSDGFTLSSASRVNQNGYPYASWSFRKQPGFFDVVTYTGNGTAGHTINHSLGSTPGMIIFKRYDSALNWYVAHRYDLSKYLVLNQTAAAGSFAVVTATSDTTFTLPNDGSTNASGGSYVAYIFAHDAQDFGTDSDESIIKCGSYTGTGSAGNSINLGFEPQWLMIKQASGVNDWYMYDTMRGITTGGDDAVGLKANSSDAEGSSNHLSVTSTGFELEGIGGGYNGSGATYIYVAIRRPHKPASEFAATDLFAIDELSVSTTPNFVSGFPVDFAINRQPVGTTSNWNVGARLIQGRRLFTNLTNAESAESNNQFDYQDGYSGANLTNYLGYLFKRAPGFFDVVAYTGTGSTLVLDHNLGVEPEFMIVKGRTINAGWWCYHKDVGNTKAVPLNTDGAASTSSFFWNDTSPTATQVTLGAFTHYNVSNQTGILYLFASVPGISKVGSYTGNGGSQTIDCGFSSSARFVFIKRTSDTSNWMLWDSARGITAATNDPFLYLNTTAAQASVSGRDIDPDPSGFALNTNYDWINLSGSEYIFLAIA
jgi:hypothetical protein